MPAPTGHVIYRGPSLLDGAPIIAVAITRSSNRKTGNMVQTYTLREDIKPTAAVASGADVSICGDCKHRPALGGACYVVVCQGPTVVWKAYTRGRYPDALNCGAIASLAIGRNVRLGTYGDPAAVPAYVWHALLTHAAGHTGYTHQWAGAGSAQYLRGIVMASADSPAERIDAAALGWRTFRVMAAGDIPGPREFTCPASVEAGHRKQCHECKACDGAARGTGQASPVIVVHGSKASRFALTLTA